MSASGRILLGMLTPSSNTVLEPVTARMLSALPDVTAHFSRFRVTEIALGGRSDAQFDMGPMLAAAELLADARCNALCWNGTSAAWLGVDRDRALCEAIRRRTSIPATSAVLALLEAFRRLEVRRFGLVTPYTDAVQAEIVRRLRSEGFECSAERHSGRQVNFEFSEVPSTAIADMVREVARAKPDAITVLCTNMDGASLAPALEAETGIPVLDSIALALWASLRLAGADAARIRGWGRLFEH